MLSISPHNSPPVSGEVESYLNGIGASLKGKIPPVPRLAPVVRFSLPFPYLKRFSSPFPSLCLQIYSVPTSLFVLSFKFLCAGVLCM